LTPDPRQDPGALARNGLWVSDFTYVITWSGVVYVAFVIDAFSRRIVGCKANTNLRTELVLDTLEMALWSRDRDGIALADDMVSHSDAGSQGGFNWSSQHLDRGGCDGQGSGMDEGVDGPSSMKSPPLGSSNSPNSAETFSCTSMTRRALAS
jgi:putative transposase